VTAARDKIHAYVDTGAAAFDRLSTSQAWRGALDRSPSTVVDRV
jgi:hypothetical protein